MFDSARKQKPARRTHGGILAISPSKPEPMQEIHYSSAAIREAMKSLDASGIPDEHKRLLIEVVARVLRNSNAEAHGGVERSDMSWQQHEVQTVAAHLEGKLAVNWQHADELVMWLVACLRRNPDDIRRKATELGFGASVDYRIAKSMPIPVDA
jgi:hypothetical protein